VLRFCKGFHDQIHKRKSYQIYSITATLICLRALRSSAPLQKSESGSMRGYKRSADIASGPMQLAETMRVGTFALWKKH